jgi:hypothetical protein
VGLAAAASEILVPVPEALRLPQYPGTNPLLRLTLRGDQLGLQIPDDDTRVMLSGLLLEVDQREALAELWVGTQAFRLDRLEIESAEGPLPCCHGLPGSMYAVVICSRLISFITSSSRSRSATRFFSRVFSCSSWRRRFTSTLSTACRSAGASRISSGH